MTAILPGGDTTPADLQDVLSGRYTIEREIGRGGMGIVYLACDVALERSVAIKLLPPRFAADDPGLRERFLREARTAAGLTHPNIVPIHLVEERGALVYFVMAFVEGDTLGALVRRGGPLSAGRVSAIAREVAWALSYAHARGVVHRDIKPDNILIDKGSGRAMVTDFGIAHVETGAAADDGVFGTPRFMSPEQATGAPVDGRSDLYSLGVTAYHALTAAWPSPGNESNAPVDDALASTIERCLELDPDDRPASADEVAASLAPAMIPETPVAIRRLFTSARGLDNALAMMPIMAIVMQRTADAFGPIATLVIGFLLIFGGPLVTVFGFVLPAMAATARAGYSLADVRRALDNVERSALDERGRAGTGVSGARARARGSWLSWGVGTLAALLAAGIVATSIENGRVPLALSTTLVLLFGAAILGHVISLGLSSPASLEKMRRSRLPGVGAGLRFIGSAAGAWLFAGISRIVARRSGNRSLATPERTLLTEDQVAGAARASFARLPVYMRERFAEVPEVLDRLSAEADRLRHDPRPGDRLFTVVAALENLRLDVARLSADLTLAGEFTESLSQAMAVSRAVDHELAARREVRALLGGSRP